MVPVPDSLGVLLGARVMAFPLGQKEAGKPGRFLTRLVDILTREPGPKLSSEKMQTMIAS